VDIGTRKFIGVAVIDHRSHLREHTGDVRGTLLHDEVVLGLHFQQELLILLDVGHKWFVTGFNRHFFLVLILNAKLVVLILIKLVFGCFGGDEQRMEGEVSAAAPLLGSLPAFLGDEPFLFSPEHQLHLGHLFDLLLDPTYALDDVLDEDLKNSMRP